MYQLTENVDVVRRADGACIPRDADNYDWQAYQQWLSEGNTPDPAAAAMFGVLRDIELNKFRADRELFLNRLAGIGLAAQHGGQTEVLDSTVAVRQGLLDLTSCAGVAAATDLDGLKTAMKAAYAAILAGVPAEVKSAFKGVDA